MINAALNFDCDQSDCSSTEDGNCLEDIDPFDSEEGDILYFARADKYRSPRDRFRAPLREQLRILPCDELSWFLPCEQSSWFNLDGETILKGEDGIRIQLAGQRNTPLEVKFQADSGWRFLEKKRALRRKHVEESFDVTPEFVAEQRRGALFDALVDKWEQDTKWVSATSQITGHAVFTELLNWGTPTIQLILRRLARNDIRWHWFPLLKRISGEDPVPPEKRGLPDKMAQEWLAWGRAKGYFTE